MALRTAENGRVTNESQITQMDELNRKKSRQQNIVAPIEKISGSVTGESDHCVWHEMLSGWWTIRTENESSGSGMYRCVE